MSNLSVNNFSRLSNDFNQQNAERPTSVDKSTGETPAKTASALLKNNPAVATEGTVTFNKDTLEKLFEMFEYAFKAIRNMLSGQGGMPKLIPDAGPRPQPEKGGDALVKDKPASNPTVLNTVLKDKAGGNPGVLNTALKDRAETNPEVPTIALKDRADKNPAVPSSVLNVAPRPQAPLEPRRPDPTLSRDVQPNNRSSSDVNVTVQVMNCHCPHPDESTPVAPKPVAPQPNVLKPDLPKPDASKPDAPRPDAPKPDVLKPNAPKADAPKPDAPKPDASKPDAPKPDAPEPDVPKPDAPKPDTPSPDVTAPGPSEVDYSQLSTSGRRRAFDNDGRGNSGRRINR